MGRFRVGITRSGLPGGGTNRLAEVVDLKVWSDNVGPTAEQLPEFLSDVDAFLGMSQDVVDRGLLGQLPRLVAIGQASAGYDNLDIDALERHSVQASNCPGVLSETTADFTWALLLAASRRLVEGDSTVRDGRWSTPTFDSFLGQDVYGKTLGIVGYGQIGQAVARRAKGFKMRVIHTSRSSVIDEVSTGVSFDELLSSADFVSVNTALTPQTHHLIDAPALAKMKSSAVLVNTSRGFVVDEAALYDALVGGEIFAAGVDVFEEEPVGKGNPLLELPNVVVSPHMGSASFATRARMVDLAVDNLLVALTGEAMPNSITPGVVPQRPSGGSK